MSSFASPVQAYMTEELIHVRPYTPLHVVHHLLVSRGFTSVPVVDDGHLVGVVSTTDILRFGRRHGGQVGGKLLRLPPFLASDIMQPGAASCDPELSLRAAAAEMLAAGVHRLYVVAGDHPIGVISTLDLTRAVRDARAEGSLADIMSTPLITIAAAATVATAVDRLAARDITALVVVEDEWPVGVFGQAEAMAALELPADALVEAAMEAAILCMPDTARIHRAAAAAARMDARRVIACRHHDAIGIISGFDFTRVVAGGAIPLPPVMEGGRLRRGIEDSPCTTTPTTTLTAANTRTRMQPSDR